jgi:hypothetical protein
MRTSFPENTNETERRETGTVCFDLLHSIKKKEVRYLRKKQRINSYFISIFKIDT